MPAPIALIALLFVASAASAAPATSLGPAAAAGGELTVTSVTPAARSLEAGIAAPISVTFDQAVDPASVNARSFTAFGRWSGPVLGSRTLSPDGRTVTLTPNALLTHGESVMVVLSSNIKATDGTPLRAAGYSFQYWTRALPGDLNYVEVASMTTRTTPSVTSRAYGGVGCDMNHDGFLDITIVNEDTADLRTFINAGDGTVSYAPFIEPPDAVGNRASPSEPADFNLDGNIDMCVADINDDTVSVVLGRGDGTFLPRQVINVGNAPRGIAVLDIDGDGDIDIVNTNSADSNLSIMTNNGFGTFSPPTFVEGGGVGEWALAAADMNEDGILDLVVGARTSQQIIVNLGNGDGTFTPLAPQASGGSVWMLTCGDVDGDGHEDVAAVNSSQNNGAILKGNGDGTLAAPQTSGTDSFPLATDLGDLDGDGDLDWVTSSFGGDWRMFTNDGTGQYSFSQEFDAPVAASCSLPIDMDNDGDLELALIDELADVVILMHQVGEPCVVDLDRDGAADFDDLLSVLGDWGPCDGCRSDFDENGVVDFADLLVLLAAWGACAG